MLRIVLLIFLFLFSFGTDNIFAYQNYNIFETSCMIENVFYTKLDSWAKLPISEQIDSLMFFINAYPAYCTPYLKLEERSLMSNRIDNMILFLKKFDTIDPQYGNAQWMLARHYTFLKQYNKAAQSYRQALNFTQPCYELLFDYLSFLKSNKPNSWKLIPQCFSNLPNMSAAIMAAYVHMLNYEYDMSARILKSYCPSEDLSVYRQYYISVYKSGDILRALEIAEQAIKTALKHGDQYNKNLFVLSKLKCKSWLFGQHTIIKELEEVENDLEGHDDLRLKNNLKKFKADLANSNLNHELAISLYEEAASGYMKVHDLNQAAHSYYNLAEQLYLIGNNTKAIETLTENLSIISYCSDFEIIARIWYLYGKIYLNLALYEMSDKSLRKAMEYALKTGNRFLIMNIEDMIRESQAMQSHPGKAAVIYANWIRECQEKGYDKLLYFNIYSLGRILLELGEYDQALVQFAAALDLAEQSQNVIQLAWTQAGIADCHLKCGHVQRAFELFNSALKTAQDKNVFQLVANIQSSMGIYYEERNQFDKAIHHYRSTIAQYEEQRETFNASELAIGFLSNKQEAYERLSECYYQKFLREKKLDYLQDIYFYEEMMRARALKQTLDTPQGIAHFHTDSSFVNLCRDYESLQRQLRRRRQNISEALLDSLIAKLQVYRYDIISEKIRLENKTKMEHGNFPPLGAVQQRLRLQTAIIYHLSNRLSYAMVIQEDSSSVVTLNVTRAEIDSLVRALMQPFHHVDSEAILNIPFEAAIAHQLYAKLFAPIEQRCRLDAHVLIIPSSSLAHLPFDMLLQKAPAEARYTPRDDPAFADFFLGLRYAFFYGPSTHILLREPLESSPRLLILANPCADSDATQDGAFTLRYRTGWRFDPLIYAEREASAIGKTCRDAKILTRRRATESAATTLAGRYSILHIASHAFADTTFELFSGLALADEKKDGDGLLMGFEIATAAFPNDLVTLSACETGRGKLIAGEGVMGLPRQFLAAGARSVIMSNWKVDDKFAAEFMPRFYQNYIEKGRSKVAALNDAKLAVLNSTSDEEIYRYRHPFFWAAFNLYGEAGQEHPPAPRQSTHHPMLIIAMFIAGMTAFVILSPERKKRVISRL